MIFWIYNLSLTVVLLLTITFSPLVFMLRKRYRKSILERLGLYPSLLTEAIGNVQHIWIHAVSVGEVLAAGRFSEHIKKRFPDRKVLLSTLTPAGRKIAEQISHSFDVIIFLPFDHPWIVKRVLNIINPILLILLETEIWPNLLSLSHRSGIPTVLLSGRLSTKSFNRYYLFRRFFSPIIKKFSALGMQDQISANKIIKLGANPNSTFVTGNIKQLSLDSDKKNIILMNDIKYFPHDSRKLFVAGSTHKGEEEILLDIFILLKLKFTNLQMILAPRHPRRFPEVERLLIRKKLNYGKMSLNNNQNLFSADILLLDTLGDLPDKYSVADVVFVGGSLVDAGGHNPIEPARLCKPVLFGPYMTNFKNIADEMINIGGAIEVKHRDDLFRELSILLSDHDKSVEIGKIASSVVSRGNKRILDLSMSLLSRYLE